MRANLVGRLLTFIVVVSMVPKQSRAQAAEPLALQRTGAITVDGVPTAAEWGSVAALPLTLYTPTFRGTPTQRSEIRVGYDDDYFYAAGWFFDTEPSKIRVNSLYRDRWNGDDALAIYIDSFNDNQNAKWFGTTAGGIRFDQLVSNDGATLNGSWDTFWDAATTVTDSGWFVEVRIPFSSIGFRTDDSGNATMGLTVTRLVSRLDERVTFPEIDPRFEFRRPSVARDVVLQGVKSRRPLYVTPYALAGTGRTIVTSQTGTLSTDRGTSREAGLDVRYPFTAGLTLDLTVNTDFAQVEADDQQVNLDRFPLFFPERRRFFQEGSGVFDFTTGNGTRLFNSRRIGLTPQLEPVRVLGGGRIVGRAGKWDIGILDMQTEKHGSTPSENFGVVRLQRPVINPWSTAGFMMTSYYGGERRNHAVGGDVSWRFHGDQYLGAKVATTSYSGDSTGSSLAEHSHVDLKLERRTARGLAYAATFTRSGRTYRPELGFMPRRDFTTANLSGNYFIFTEKHPVLRRVYPGAIVFTTFRNSDGVLESGTYAAWVQWDTKAGGGGWIEPKYFHENVAAPFTIGKKLTVPAGLYRFADLQIVGFMSTGSRLRTSVDLRAGTYFDGRRSQAILGPTWNVSPHLELGADYQLTALSFSERDQSEKIHVARMRIRTALDARRSGNAFIQYNSTTERLDFNVRLRYAFAEGTDLWLVYNEGLDTERTYDPLGVRTPMSLARTLILKYSHTFGL